MLRPDNGCAPSSRRAQQSTGLLHLIFRISSMTTIPKRNTPVGWCFWFGGLEEIRTPDPHNANVVRSQLRYKPIGYQKIISLRIGFVKCPELQMQFRACMLVVALGQNCCQPLIQRQHFMHRPIQNGLIPSAFQGNGAQNRLFSLQTSSWEV